MLIISYIYDDIRLRGLYIYHPLMARTSPDLCQAPHGGFFLALLSKRRVSPQSQAAAKEPKPKPPKPMPLGKAFVSLRSP